MSAALPAQDPKAEATRRQSEASHPHVSAWVSANAGSGKTHVLARRVIRLLLAGTPPGRILCLTYTKAAAANMANRVLAILGHWVRLPDADLDAAIAETVGTASDVALRARARRLFAAALETPGGLKIQTIHAFCGGLLHRFPFEADVAAGFRELDEVGRLDLMARIRSGLVIDATADTASPLGEALGRLTEDLSDQGLSGLLDAAIALRARILPLGATGAARRGAVARALGLAADARVADIEAEMRAGEVLPPSEWRVFAAEIAASDKKTDQERAADLLAAAEAGDPASSLAAYRRVFFGSDGPRSDRNLLTKGLADRLPVLAEAMRAERDRLARLDDALRSARTLERTEAALTLAAEACRRYEMEKAARGLLDFDDLITKAARLLTDQPTFVQFKLDQGIDHILVDEAQDTSPEQWRVVEGLATDFFSGEGARPGVKRTIFVVGDEKQSIFSFQGADPRAFGGMRATFERKAGPGAFRRVELPHSFRSAPGVLEAVDTIFSRAEAHSGLTLDAVAPVHAAIRADAPALVEVWPTTVPDPRPQPDNWRRPLDEAPADDPVSRLAARIAGFIREGIATGLAIPSRQGRPMKAGDVLVLVRRRGRIFEAIIRALKDLKDARVQVAGADRLVVAEHIAALDLMALGDVLVSPDDDLALAALLKSPLFGFTDDDLMELCPGRPGRLADALAALAPRDPRAAAVVARLEGWRRQGLALRPFDFYARVLGRDGGRRAMLARLGPEAADVLDEFMALARAYEATEPPSLAGFLAFLRCGGAETKRDMESGRDEVRVMTVHGAKGLEAPVVILADTVDMPRARTSGGLICVPGADGDVPVLAPRKAEDPEVLATARATAAARELEEHRRLLYVALTRAEDAVIVCGAETREPAKGKVHARPEGCWYDLVRTALEADAQEVPALGFDGAVLRWSKGAGLATAGPAPATIAAAVAAAEVVAFPHPPPAQPAPRLLRPSRADVAALSSPRSSPVDTGGLAPLVRGDLIHRLLAGLPDLPASERREAGLRLLRHAADGVDAALHHDVLEEALGVLGHAPLADLFGAGSRAEVPVIGRLPGLDGIPFHVNGRIDRLLVQAGTILVADFKTDRTPPQSAEDVAETYVAQLAVYGALLSEALGGLPFEARLVYTATPRVFVLDGRRLSAALEGLGLSPRRDAP